MCWLAFRSRRRRWCKVWSGSAFRFSHVPLWLSGANRFPPRLATGCSTTSTSTRRANRTRLDSHGNSSFRQFSLSKAFSKVKNVKKARRVTALFSLISKSLFNNWHYRPVFTKNGKTHFPTAFLNAYHDSQFPDLTFWKIKWEPPCVRSIPVKFIIFSF